MHRKIKFLVFSLGLFASSAQIIVFRQFITSFDSTALAISSFFFSWFFWIATATLLFYKTNFIRGLTNKSFPCLFLLYLPALILQFLLFLKFREISSIKQYAEIGLIRFFLWSIALNCPIAVLNTIFFQASSDFFGDEPDAVATTHRLDAAGSFIGGVLSALLFSFNTPSLTLTFISASILTLSIAITIRQKIKKITVFAIFAILVLSLLIRLDIKLNEKIAIINWSRILPKESYLGTFRTYQAEYYFGEYYEQLLFAKYHGIYENIPSDEDTVQPLTFAYSQQSSYKNILCAGGGLSTPLVFAKFAKTFAFPDDIQYANIARTILKNKNIFPDEDRLTIVQNDIRQFLQNNSNLKFDLVYISLAGFDHPPSIRLCSTEFISILKKSLFDNSIVIFSFESGENFLGDELSFIGATLQKTISEHFKHVEIFPGELSFIIASDCPLKTGLSEMQETLQLAAKNNINVKPYSINALYSPDRAKFASEAFRRASEKTIIKMISDIDPILPFPELLLSLKKSSLNASILLDFFKLRNFVCALPVLIFLFALATFAYQNRGKTHLINLNKAILFLNGFSSMGIVLILLNLYQITIGNIYVFFGLVSSLFMLGIYLGNSGYRKFKLSKIPQIISLQLLILLLNLFYLSFLILAIENLSNNVIFAILFLFYGFINGFIFASSISNSVEKESQTLLSLPYASSAILSDNSGAAIATLSFGIFIVPISGLRNALFLLILIGILKIFLAFIQIQEKKNKTKGLTPERFLVSIILAFGISSIILYHWLNLYESKKSSKDQPDSSIPEMILKKLANNMEIHREKINHPEFGEILYYEVWTNHTKKGYIFRSWDFCRDIEGFSGPFDIAIFAKTDGSLISYQVLKHSDTENYVKRTLEKLNLENCRINCIEDTEKIELVSGATLSSEAIRDTIFTAGREFFKLLSETETTSVKKSHSRKSTLNQSFPIIFYALLFLLSIYASFKNIFKLRLFVLLSSSIILGILLNRQFSSEDVINMIFNPKNTPFYTILIAMTTLIFTNYHCGYICPFGALQELLHLTFRFFIMKKRIYRFFKYGNLTYIKFIILFFIVVLFPFLRRNIMGNLDPLIAIFAIKQPFGIAVWIGFLSLLMSIIIPRFWCRTLCPAGAFLAICALISPFRRKFPPKIYRFCPFSVKSRDIDCLVCDVCRHLKKKEQSQTSNISLDKPSKTIFNKNFILYFLIMCLFACICMRLFSNSDETKSANIKNEKAKITIKLSDQPPPSQTRKADMNKIRGKIDSKQLSNKEAMFYQRL